MFLCVFQTQNKCYLLTNTAAGTSYMQTYSEKYLKEIHSVAIFFLSVEEPSLEKVLLDSFFHRRQKMRSPNPFHLKAHLYYKHHSHGKQLLTRTITTYP